jgi:hypothetical protein
MPRLSPIRPGQPYGLLTVREKIQGRRWLCDCKCGGSKVVLSYNLTSGATQSCGCREKANRKAIGDRTRTHGKRYAPVYAAYQNMIRRCYDRKNHKYPSYGARGITVCRRWRGKNGFVNFLADMGEPPFGYTIERKKNDGPYTPENCRWATKGDQNRNKRSNIMATKDGRTQPLKTWANELGYSYGALWARVKTGWSPNEAIAHPVGPVGTNKIERVIDAEIPASEGSAPV